MTSPIRPTLATVTLTETPNDMFVLAFAFESAADTAADAQAPAVVEMLAHRASVLYAAAAEAYYERGQMINAAFSRHASNRMARDAANATDKRN